MGKERTKVNADRQRPRYNREFKLEAVRLLGLGQKPATQASL
jgi:transposase